MVWSEEIVLVTGGAGSFGRALTELMVRDCAPKKVIIFSRDELKHEEMRTARFDQSRVEYIIGDVRDRGTLERTLSDVTILVHAAALKHVHVCESNPREAIRTNVVGAINTIDAALCCGVRRVLALSTDKAVEPTSVYGASKLCAEKLFIQVNPRTRREAAFSCVRLGNLVGSRGSVTAVFLQQSKRGTITVTDPRMTRFWMGLKQAARFVVDCLECMQGGEIFVPKIPSMRLGDVAQTFAKDCKIEYIGIRPGEKLHETLISNNEARQTLEAEDMYVIDPDQSIRNPAEPVPDTFEYRSDTNAHWLSIGEFKELLAENVDSAGLYGTVERRTSRAEYRRTV